MQVGFFQLLRPTVSFFFSSLGFPDLETGSCRWGSSNWGGGGFLRGVLPTVGFSSLGFPDLEMGFVLGGASANCVQTRRTRLKYSSVEHWGGVFSHLRN